MSAKETKEKILKCTTELLLERGGDIGNVTIRTIAARAGIGVGLTNHYFSSKEQLIEECIESVFSELFEMLGGEGSYKPSEIHSDPGSDEISVNGSGSTEEPETAAKAGSDNITGLPEAQPADTAEDTSDLDLDDELLSGLYETDEFESDTAGPENVSPSVLEMSEESGTDEVTRKTAGMVMDFLIRNEAIAKAALSRDVQNPLSTDYTARLTDAFAYAMVDKKKLDEIENNDRMTERMKEQFKEHIINEQKLKAFMIMSSVKEALIRREVLKTSMDIDLKDDEQRDRYVDSLMELLY